MYAPVPTYRPPSYLDFLDAYSQQAPQQQPTPKIPSGVLDSLIGGSAGGGLVGGGAGVGAGVGTGVGVGAGAAGSGAFGSGAMLGGQTLLNYTPIGSTLGSGAAGATGVSSMASIAGAALPIAAVAATPIIAKALNPYIMKAVRRLTGKRAPPRLYNENEVVAKNTFNESLPGFSQLAEPKQREFVQKLRENKIRIGLPGRSEKGPDGQLVTKQASKELPAFLQDLTDIYSASRRGNEQQDNAFRFGGRIPKDFTLDKAMENPRLSKSTRNKLETIRSAFQEVSRDQMLPGSTNGGGGRLQIPRAQNQGMGTEGLPVANDLIAKLPKGRNIIDTEELKKNQNTIQRLQSQLPKLAGGFQIPRVSSQTQPGMRFF